MNIFRVLLIISIISCMSLGMEENVAAAENPFSLRVSPSFHDIKLAENAPNQEITTSITNLSTQDVVINLSVLDIHQVPPKGQIQFLSQKNPVTKSIQPYISFPEDAITLKPNQTKKIAATINTQNMGAGGYYGGIIFQAGNVHEAGTSAALPAVSSLIFIAKDGDIKPALRIHSVTGIPKFISFSHPRDVSIQFSNTGNVHLTPYGRAQIYDIRGNLTGKSIINESSLRILPNTTIAIDTKITPIAFNFPFSVNKVLVSGQDANKLTSYVYEDTYLYVNPMFLGMLVVLLAIIVVKRKMIVHHIIEIRRKLKGTVVVKKRT